MTFNAFKIKLKYTLLFERYSKPLLPWKLELRFSEILQLTVERVIHLIIYHNCI